MKQGGTKTTAVPGFQFSGLSAGIKESGKSDLALLYSETPAVAAGLFTQNKVKAAPVKLALQSIGSGKGQAIIINSGNANACTGRQGMEDARTMRTATARQLGVAAELVYVSSTGIIGVPLPLAKISRALPSLAENLSPRSLMDTATAIMTTDTFPKASFRKIMINGKRGTIAGIAKGAGMICPDMATMLCYFVTDIAVNRFALDAALREATALSFNCLSVDNDMSTNDTVMILSNARLGNKTITKKSSWFSTFTAALTGLAVDLAQMIAADGEGATKVIEVRVEGARSRADAERVASAVANSMLVKTAIYGRDPNWGRIIAAAGYSGADIREESTDIYLNNIQIVQNGSGTAARERARRTLDRKTVAIRIHLGIGKGSGRAVTCDLTEEYIKINAHYTT